MEDQDERSEALEESAEQPSSPEEGEMVAPEGGGEAAAAKSKKGFLGKVDNFFGITASGSNFKREIIAGLTTFMAMVYILMVNAGMFAEDFVGISYGAAYIATAIGAVAGTMLMAFLAKMPLAQASGMGINAFIVYTLLAKTGLTYANSMVFVLLDGVIFLILTVTGLRKKIFDAIPKAVRIAIPVGIGMFIAFIGFQQAGVIVNDAALVLDEAGMPVLDPQTGLPQISSATIVAFTSAFNVLGEGWSYGAMIAPLVCLLGVVAIGVMSKKNVKGAILWGILGATGLYFALAGLGCAWKDEVCLTIFKEIGEKFTFNPFGAFADWGKESAAVVFYKGFSFEHYLGIEGNNVGTLILLLFTSALSLCMIDMFDTIGTLYGACSKGNLLDKNGVPKNMNKMMLADAIATCTGAIAGTSTVTTFVESSSGVAAGGKTGFTALTTGILFFIAMFLSPIAQLIPRCATASALIWVGVLMMTSVKDIDWTDPAEALVAFATFIIMILGYSISKGIGIGILAYVLIKLCTGKVKEISAPTWVIGILFLATFILT